MKHNKKRPDFLFLFAVICLLIIAGILISYFLKFPQGLSNVHQQWGEFGSLFGAITGLVAFVGVLFTLRQSKRQGERSEERSVFFTMLNIFDQNREKIIAESKAEDRPEIEDKREKRIWLKGHEAFGLISELYLGVLNMHAVNSAPEIFKDYMDLEKMIFADPTFEKVDNLHDDIKMGIANIYIEYNTRPDEKDETEQIADWIYESIGHRIINHYFSTGNIPMILELFRRTADEVFEIYRNQLGTYLRNVYYLLDLLVSFTGDNNYGAIFRAQLSKDDLIIIFFNAFSSQATDKTRDYYLLFSIFNNMKWEDLKLQQKGYVANEQLKRLYDNIDY